VLLRLPVGLGLDAAEDAGDVPVLLELGTPEIDLSSSSDRAKKRLSVHNLRRVVVEETNVVRGVVLVVEGEIEGRVLEMHRVCWTDALGLGGADHSSVCLTELSPVAEGVVSVVNVQSPVERHEARPLEDNLCVSRHGSVVWLDPCDLWFVVVPVAEWLQGILLPVEGYRERHGPLHDVRVSGTAPDRPRALVVGLRTVSTKVAPEVLSQVEEMLTPDLDYRVSILWTIPRVDSANPKRLVVPVRKTRVDVVEFARQ